MTSQQQWIIADKDGNSILEYKSFISMDYKAESKVLQEPVEEGSFATYNKVATSQEVSVVIAIQGADAIRQQAKDAIAKLDASTDLIQVITPSGSTPLSTISKYSFRHSEGVSASLLILEITLTEVRQVEAQYTTTKTKPISKGQAKNKGDVSRTDKGKVQPEQPKGKSVLKDLGF